MLFTDNFSTSTTSPSPPPEPDDISAFLRHILHRTTTLTPPSPSLPTVTPMRSHAGDHHPTFPFSSSSSLLPVITSTTPPAVFSGSDRLVVDLSSHDHLNAVVTGGSHFSSNHDFTEDCDYESEEGGEAVVVVGGAEVKQSSSRNQAKRTRAAEVHNLSEKRRRSRINEKMKALQNLIPNSNKTDKASMLDEAIEYLKQLQLQVQMLSMRNGLSLHPMCLPEDQGILNATQLSPIGMHNLNNSSGSFDVNMTNALNTIPETSHSRFNLANQCASSSRPSLPPSVSTAVISEPATYGLDSGLEPDIQSFQLHNPHQAVCREQSVPHERLGINRTEMKSLVTSAPGLFDTGELRIEGQSSLDACIQTKYASQGTLLEGILRQNQRIRGTFSGLNAANTNVHSDKLTIRR